MSPDIFSAHGNYEFVVVKGWDGNVCLRSGSYNYGFNPIKNFFGEAPETTYEPVNGGAEVYCSVRSAEVLDFDEALKFFQKKDKNKSNKIYLRIEYETDRSLTRKTGHYREWSYPDQRLRTS